MGWKLEGVEDNDPSKEDRILSPYADWECETRADHAKEVWTVTIPGSAGQGGGAGTQPITYKIDLPLLMPVYIRVKGEDGETIRENAELIITKSITEDEFQSLVLSDDSRKGLSKLAALGDDAPASGLRYQIVYLCEPGVVPEDLQDALKVLHVGPVVPGLSLRYALALLESRGRCGEPDREADEAAKVEATGTDPEETPPVLPAPVVTAVIDSEIGIANERFCIDDGKTRKTRVQRFWRQQREVLTPFRDIGVGREFDASAINRMLEEARGDERRFYELMCSGGCGEPKKKAVHDMLAAPRDQIELLLKALECFPDRASSDPLVQVTTAEGAVVPVQDVKEKLQGLLEGDPAALGAIALRAPAYVTDERSRPLGLRAAHGSFVADLAAGAPQDDAPADRPIVAVELPDYVVADTAGQRLEIFCLMGVRRILDWVDNWDVGDGTARVPVVINISLGNTAGPRDGTGFLEAEIARLVAAREAGGGPATKVVIAAGNSYRARLSAGMQLLTGQSETLDWCVPPGSRAPAFLEIRVPEGVDVEIAPPGDDWKLVNNRGVQDLVCGGARVGRIYGQARTNGDGGRRVTVALAPTLALDPPLAPTSTEPPPPARPVRQAPAGRYRLRLTNRDDPPATVKIDVQRCDTLIGWPKYGRQSRLDHPGLCRRNPETGAYNLPAADCPVARDHTLSAHGTSPSPQVFVVGGAVAGDPPRPARYTGAGPSYGPRVAPDLAAVSEDGPATPGRRAAGYLSGSTTVYRGTSSAAPQIARRIVEVLAGEGGEDAGRTKEDILAALHPAGAIGPSDLRLGRGVLAPRPEPGRKPRRGAVSG